MPNYPATSLNLTYKKKPYPTDGHEKFVGTALSQLSEINERKQPLSVYIPTLLIASVVDFEQPRALWQKVFDDTAKEHLVHNVAGHLGNAKEEIKARQCERRLNYRDMLLLTQVMSRSERVRRRRSRLVGPHCQGYGRGDRPADDSETRQ